MKKFILSFVVFCSSMVLYAQGAKQYMDEVSAIYVDLQNDFWSYSRSVSRGTNAAKLEKNRLDLLTTCESKLSTAREMSASQGENEYIFTTILYLSDVSKLLSEDYAAVTAIEPMIEDSKESLEEYMMLRSEALEKHVEAIDRLSRAEKLFAVENDVDIETKRVDDQIMASSQVFNHFNEVFMIYFESKIVELKFIEALKGDSIEAIMNSKISTKYVLDEQLDQLAFFEVYEGDSSMVQGAQSIINFYLSELTLAEAAVKYLKKSKHLEKVEKLIESKKKEEISQQDKDDLKEAKNALKIAQEEYEALREENDKLRVKQLDEWETVGQEFINKYVPEEQ